MTINTVLENLESSIALITLVGCAEREHYRFTGAGWQILDLVEPAEPGAYGFYLPDREFRTLYANSISHALRHAFQVDGAGALGLCKDERHDLIESALNSALEDAMRLGHTEQSQVLATLRGVRLGLSNLQVEGVLE